MNKDLFKYLKSYSCGTFKTNRLLVSSFLAENEIKVKNNKLIASLLITEEDEDYTQLRDFRSNYKIRTLEDLITAFEFVISPEEKVITGAVYTPVKIRNFILHGVVNECDTESPKICDLACGCGSFLLSASKLLKGNGQLTYSEIFEKCIFGIDLMEHAIERTKILLSLLAISSNEDKEDFKFNLFVHNSLSFDVEENITNFTGFDIIIGNPPYVCSRNIDKESKELVTRYEVSSSGHPDLYIPFFEIGINFLKPGGVLGFITMNTFFKSLNGRSLRAYFERHKFAIKIIDFGGEQIFNSRSTYTCVCQIKKKEASSLKYRKIEDMERLSFSNMNSISYSNLNSKTGWNLQSFDTVNRIESTGVPFCDIFKTSSGIATLKNNIYILDVIDEDLLFYYLKDGSKIEKSVCSDIVNPNKLIRKSELDSIRKTIIFPYQYNEGKATVYDEKEFAENFPYALRYLRKNREELATRDKGYGKYPAWYAYGRSQGLERYKYKLLFPHITPIIPKFVLSEDPSLLFHNGMALVSDDYYQLKLAQKIMSSRLFWFYVQKTSKPYGSGYYSLSRNYIKNFGVYDFSDCEKETFLSMSDSRQSNEFLESLYNIDLK